MRSALCHFPQSSGHSAKFLHATNQIEMSLIAKGLNECGVTHVYKIPMSEAVTRYMNPAYSAFISLSGQLVWSLYSLIELSRQSYVS